MELSREDIEDFRKAYKSDLGEELTYKQAHEIAHRLVGVFRLLEHAALKREADMSGLDEQQ